LDSTLPSSARSVLRARKFRFEEIIMPAPAYIISRIADPIFAVVMGISAAAMRINREEKEKGRTTQQTVDAALR